MNYKKLKKYLIKDMRMSHVYQPVMIRNLIVNKGKAEVLPSKVHSPVAYSDGDLGRNITLN